MLPLKSRLSDGTEQQGTKLVKATAENVDEAVRELPDANLVRDQKTCGLYILNLYFQSPIKKIVLNGHR